MLHQFDWKGCPALNQRLFLDARIVILHVNRALKSVFKVILQQVRKDIAKNLHTSTFSTGLRELYALTFNEMLLYPRILGIFDNLIFVEFRLLILLYFAMDKLDKPKKGGNCAPISTFDRRVIVKNSN